MEKYPSISVVIPALNEEGNIKNTVATVTGAFAGRTSDYEIIIFNDASSDNTGDIADRLAAEDSHVKVVHNSKNMGIGYNFLAGAKLAKFDYFTLVPGDNEISAESINDLFKNAGKSDIVMLYTINPKVRPLSRRLISRVFITLMNSLFFLKIRYYNGPCLIKTSLLTQLKLKSHSFAYMAVILVQLIKNGATFSEVGMMIQPRQYGRSKALGLKNAFSVLKDIWKLFVAVYFKNILTAKNIVIFFVLILILCIASYYRISAMERDIRIRNGFEMSVSMASYLFKNPAAYKEGSLVKREYNFYDSFPLQEYGKYTNDADKFVFLKNPPMDSFSKQNMAKSRSELGWAFILRYIFPDKITGSVNMALRVVKFNFIIELVMTVLLFFIGKRIAGVLGAVSVSLLYALFMTAVHMMCYVTYYYWAIPFSVFSLFFWIVLYRQPPYPQYFKKKLMLFFCYGIVMGFGAATRMVLLFLPIFLSPFILLKEKKLKITFILTAVMLCGQFLLLLPQMFINRNQFGRFALSTRETWHQFFMGIGSRQNPLGIENSGDFAAFDYIKKTTGVDYFKDGTDAYNRASQKQALKIIKENPRLLMRNAIENIKAAQLINPTAFYAIDTPFNKFTSFADIQLVNFYSLNAYPFLKKYFFLMVLLAALLLLLCCRQRFLLFGIVIAQSMYLIFVVCLYFPNYLYFMSGYIPAWIVLVGLSAAIIIREPVLYIRSLIVSKKINKNAF